MSKEGLNFAARCTWNCGMEDERDEILLKFIEKKEDWSFKETTKALEESNPYAWYQFIAWLKKIDDVFDEEVINLFWKPGELLRRIEKRAFEEFLNESEILKPKQDHLLAQIPGDYFYPYHNFLILSDFPKEALNEEILDRLNNCKFDAGRVTAIGEGGPEVYYPKLIYDKESKFSLIRAKKWIKKGLLKSIHEQEVVFFHYNLVRDRGSEQEMNSSWRATEEAIKLFNQGSKK
jgi:hypothetical protein